MLSCIDGKASLDELADLSGMPRAQLEAAIARLAELGAIVIEEPATTDASATVAPRVPRPPSGVREPGASTAQPSGEQGLDEAVDLAPDRRKMVLETFARLHRVDYYALLGIPDTADKNEVRNAYFSLSKLFHPDTMYGKQLGSYKAKMEAIFKRATEAYETLSKRTRREEYDASLGLPDIEARIEAAARASTQEKAAPAPADPSSDAGRISSVRPRPMVEVAESGGGASSEARFPRPSVAARQGESSRPSEEAARSRSESQPRPESGVQVPRSPNSIASDSARQKAQQRILNQIAQLTGRTPTPIPPPKPPASPRSTDVPSRPAIESPSGRDSILRDLAGSLRDAGRVTGPDRLEKVLRTAAAAEQSGDVLGAFNALRAAHDAAPQRDDITAAYRRVRFVLAKSQAASYENQALREEKMEMWGAASVSWARVAEGRPDSALAHRRAAHCILVSNGDMKRARDLAQRAVELAPRDIAGRVTLAKVYLAAGMKLNARRELEAAAKLDPKDEFVKNLLREMKL